MQSIWEDAPMPRFPALERDICTDTLVIGGGLCGLLCAHALTQAGADCVTVEAGSVCSGVTGRSTAKITSQHGLCYHTIANRFGLAAAKQYLQAQDAAVLELSRLCAQTDCDYERRSLSVYSLRSRAEAAQEAAILAKLGRPAVFSETAPLPFPVAGVVTVENQAQFHPRKFAAAIAAPLRIYERTKVRALVGTTAVTDGGSINARNIIVATHFPFLNKHGLYPLKLYQHRSYVLALKGAPQPDGMYVDAASSGLSFRGAGELLLLGGGGHRTGKSGGNWAALRNFAARYAPHAEEVCHWATQDCMSLDGLPYIGRYSARTEGLYVATGFSKWGMSSSMVAATLLRDLLLGRQTPAARLFDPSRSLLHPQLAVNAWE